MKFSKAGLKMKRPHLSYAYLAFFILFSIHKNFSKLNSYNSQWLSPAVRHEGRHESKKNENSFSKIIVPRNSTHAVLKTVSFYTSTFFV